MIRALRRAAAIGALVLALGARPAVAEPRVLTLHEAIALAIARDPALAGARIEVIDAEAHQLAARGVYEPTLELDASAQDGKHDPRVLPYVEETSREQVVASASMTKRFEDGGRFVLGVGAAAERVGSRIPTVGDAATDLRITTFTPTVEARLDEPLLGGRRAGGDDTARLGELRTASELDAMATAEQVVRDVDRAYWELYFAQQEVVIRGNAIALAEGQLRLVQSEIARGARPALAATEVEEELARRREDALVARGAVDEQAVALALLLGLPADTQLTSADQPPSSPATAGAAPSPAEVIAAALDHSPRLRAALHRGDAAGFELDKVADTARWHVDGYVRGTLSSPEDRVRTALADTSAYEGWTAEVGVSIKLPLGAAANRGANDAARAELVKARIDTTDLAAQVTASATRAANRLAIAIQRRTALTRSVELAQANLDAEQHRWSRGDGTSFELLRRQAALADAQLRAARARIDELAARADVDVLTGQLLATHGVATDTIASARADRRR